MGTETSSRDSMMAAGKECPVRQDKNLEIDKEVKM